MEKGIRIQVVLESVLYRVSLKEFFIEDLFYHIPNIGDIISVIDFTHYFNDSLNEDDYSFSNPECPINPKISFARFIDDESWVIKEKSWNKDNDGMYITLHLIGTNR